MSNANKILEVNEPWFSLIRSGIKTIEGRAGNLQRFHGWLGEKIVLKNKEECITVLVKTIQHYPDLKEFIQDSKVELSKLLPGTTSKEEASKIYLGIYSEELIKSRGGMCALFLDILN